MSHAHSRAGDYTKTCIPGGENHRAIWGSNLPPWENFKESNTCIRDLKEEQKWSKDLRLIINLWPRDPPMATIPEEIIIMSQSA